MAGATGTIGLDWLARFETFDRVGSTNDVVAGWLRDGTPEVCLAVADEQAAGRGRSGRTWTAPPGAALLASLGFRPTWLAPDRAWQLSAVVSLAMAEAGEAVANLAGGSIRLKWPNDLVAVARREALRPGDDDPLPVRKLGGVLGESDGLGTANPRVVVGIGVNAGWPSSAFPPNLAGSMTSLAELGTGGDSNGTIDRDRTIDRDALIEAFIGQLEPHVESLRAGRFAEDEWRRRQLTNGLLVRLERPDGSAETVSAVDVDPGTGALLVRSPGDTGPTRPVLVGEIRHLRVGGLV